eukprot:CAMPEP_0185802556 /NCGR_PEP_ID=MMETSP1322-20130828/2058_1 /TAXON_ID=265543 /ORGANISM="Minutocellus polymorphus, Strain RCC2270" /LENGTH=118 /DNA_ID=CAMNT_0028498317 /DNA_START=237 /DNA_END=593 /DNA_ORIENTATION=+
MATRAIAISKVAAPAPRGVAQRHLSTSGAIAVEKLRDVIDAYRRENYVHELPSRCKKDMLAVADKNKDGRIPVEGIETLLRNIGASDCMSRAEIETILSEEGESHAKVIERDHLMNLI